MRRDFVVDTFGRIYLNGHHVAYIKRDAPPLVLDEFGDILRVSVPVPTEMGEVVEKEAR